MLLKIPLGTRKPVANQYLFILSPPYCGSTLLSQIICSSKRVSVNNPDGTREGQTLPGAREIMFGENRWQDDCQVDWQAVKRIWRQHWDATKPVLLEKSPPNLIRAAEIEEQFDPASFLVLVRDPFAHCESQLRRNGSPIAETAQFAIRCLQWQQRNLEQLQRTLLVRYEDLTDQPRSTLKSISRFLPALGRLSATGSFHVHNYHQRDLELVNLNSENISRLSGLQIAEIAEHLAPHRELLQFFGYGINGGNH